MLTVPSSVRIYLASQCVDMRKGFDGLMAIVQNDWRLDVYSGHLYVFVGRRRDRVKILLWEQGGFVIYYRRLERGRFQLPAIEPDANTVTLDGTQLAMLLDGIDVGQVRRPRHWAPPSPRPMAPPPPRMGWPHPAPR